MCRYQVEGQRHTLSRPPLRLQADLSPSPVNNYTSPVTVGNLPVYIPIALDLDARYWK